VSVTADRRAAAGVPARLWVAAQAHHAELLVSPFITTLLHRRPPWKAYGELLSQLYFLHESLAQVEAVMAAGPAARALARSTAVSLPLLAADLRFLYGARWQCSITAYPATAAYCTDLRDTAVRGPQEFTAHHYARHMEDLLISRDVATVACVGYGLDQGGCRYLTPSDITPAAYHEAQRGVLDRRPAPPLDAGLMAETARVHQLFVAVMYDLGRAWG
jgi:heme oxygenase